MPKTSSKPKSEYAIQTVTNALRMLEVFHAETEMGVSDLARRLGLHKNNAFRLLATLELAGYIQQTPSTELYHLGPRCLELGQAFARSHTLMDRARPILQSLAAEQGETAHLGVLSGREVVHLDGALPDQLVLTGLRVGRRLGAHCTALGKVLLAGEMGGRRASSGAAASSEQAPAPLDALLGEAPLDQHTRATLADPEKLVDELRAVQLRGYATDVEEYAPGLRCVAAPVRDGSARVVAALSLSGPAMRLDEERLHGAIAAAVTDAADRLSAAIGGA
jgi:DNA-binding IclR family transcriptional regulator